MNGEELFSADEPSQSEPNDLRDGNSRGDISAADEERLIELVGFLVQNIVSHAEEVEVEEFFDDTGTVYGVRVHPDDLGRVIGREGRVANALRSLTRAAAIKSGARVTVEVITEDSQLRLDEA